MDERAIGERWMALFLVGVLAFSPPLLLVFNVRATLFGLPVLYLYLFSVWAVVIAFSAAIAARSAGRKDQRASNPPEPR